MKKKCDERKEEGEVEKNIFLKPNSHLSAPEDRRPRGHMLL